ncbi:MAG TPA: Crp/Fnr family transcriptional regulator [Bacillota bacterium]
MDDDLRSFPLFSDLTQADLAALGALVRERRYRDGMYVFAEGDPVEAVYFVKSGMVKAARTDAEGREQIVSVLTNGDFFPHVGFLDGGPAPATATTVGATCLGLVGRKDFSALLTEHPQLTMGLLAVMERRIRGLQEQVRDLGLMTAPSRVGRILLRLAGQIGVDQGHRRLLRLELSQQDLANMAGVSRETVSRILGEFRRDGIIAGEAGELLIDVRTLEELV